MKIKDVMTTEYVTVKPETTWLEAVKLLLFSGKSAAIVVDEEEAVVGILSEKDLFRGLYPAYRKWAENPTHYADFDRLETNAREAAGRTVGKLMTDRVITADCDTHVLKIGGQMVASGIHHIPVVSDGKLVGMVSRGTIYRRILKEYFDSEL